MSESWDWLIPRPRSRFIQVVCNECGNRQVVFEHAKTVVKCRVCGAVLARPAGGTAIIVARRERALE